MFHCNQCNKQTPRYDQKCTVCGSIMEEVTVRRTNSLCLKCCQYIPKNSVKCPTCRLRILTDYEKISEERRRDHDRQIREANSRNGPLPEFLQNIADDMNLQPSPPGQTSTSATTNPNIGLVQEPVEPLPPFLANLAQENNLVPSSNNSQSSNAQSSNAQSSNAQSSNSQSGNSQSNNVPQSSNTTNSYVGNATLTQPNGNPEPIQVQVIDPPVSSQPIIVDYPVPNNYTSSSSNPVNNQPTTQIIPVSNNSSSNDLVTNTYTSPNQPWTLNVTIGPIIINNYYNSCPDCDYSGESYYDDGRLTTYQSSNQNNNRNSYSERNRHRHVTKRHHSRDGTITRETTVDCNVPNCRKCRKLGVIN